MKPDNDERDTTQAAMEKWWVFKYPKSWSIADETSRKILLEFGRDCIEYERSRQNAKGSLGEPVTDWGKGHQQGVLDERKRLAETAGQFDEQETLAEGSSRYPTGTDEIRDMFFSRKAFLEGSRWQHERTASGYEAKLKEQWSLFDATKCRLIKERDDALALIKKLKETNKHLEECYHATFKREKDLQSKYDSQFEINRGLMRERERVATGKLNCEDCGAILAKW